MKIRLKVKLIYVISNFSRRLQQGGKYCSLQFVGQLVKSRKVHKTLRSAERAPTLSAGRKILVEVKAAHYRQSQSFGDDGLK